MDFEDISNLTENCEKVFKEKLNLAEINGTLEYIEKMDEARKISHRFILLGIPAIAVVITFLVSPLLTVGQLASQLSLVVSVMASAEVINISINGSKSKNKKKIKDLNNRKMSTELVIETLEKEIENEKHSLSNEIKEEPSKIISVPTNVELDNNMSLNLRKENK